MHDHSTKNWGLHWYISFICTRPFDKNIWPFSYLFFLCARPFDQKLVSSLIYFFYLYMTIRSKLGVTLKFIIFLIEPIFCLQYCLYISSATIIPLYSVYYIHRSAVFIFRTLYPRLQSATIIPLYFVYYIHRNAAFISRTLYPWLYEVLATFPRFRDYQKTD